MSSYFEAGQDSITFLFPGQEENNQTIRYADLGWSPEQIRYHVAFPSFSQADFILLADLICYGDDGLPLAVLLTGFPLEEDAVVRQIGDLYGNSLKRLTGQRPVIFLLTGQTCKAVYSLLGDVQPADRPLSKQELEDLVSNYALQEVVTFQFLQQDKLAAQSFFRQETEEKEPRKKSKLPLRIPSPVPRKSAIKNICATMSIPRRKTGKNCPNSFCCSPPLARRNTITCASKTVLP